MVFHLSPAVLTVDLRSWVESGALNDFRNFFLPFDSHDMEPMNALNLFEALDGFYANIDSLLCLLFFMENAPRAKRIRNMPKKNAVKGTIHESR